MNEVYRQYKGSRDRRAVEDYFIGANFCTQYNIFGRCNYSKSHQLHRCIFCGKRHPGSNCDAVPFKTGNQWKLMTDKWNQGGFKTKQYYDKDKQRQYYDKDKGKDRKDYKK